MADLQTLTRVLCHCRLAIKTVQLIPLNQPWSSRTAWQNTTLNRSVGFVFHPSAPLSLLIKMALVVPRFVLFYLFPMIVKMVNIAFDWIVW